MKNWAALLGALGLVAFGFGLLSALLAIFQPVTDIAWVWGNLVIGFVLIAASVFVNLDALRARMRSGEGRRAGKYGTNAIASAFLGVAILGLLGFLSVRYSHRFDWSEGKVHTLSDQTQKVLEQLDEDVALTAFFNPLDGPQVRDLLERYSNTSPRVTLEFADPTARPDLVASLGVDEADLAKGIVRVSAGGASVDVTEEFSESAVTNALVKLTRGGGKKVYFLQGHNERAFDGEAANEALGLGRAVTALINETYEVQGLMLAAAGSVPEDADVVIVAGPTRPLFDVEHEALEAYLERGGALLVLLDPRANSDLADDLARWGVELGNDVIVDRQLALFGRATTPFAAVYSESHPITREMRETTLFHVARSVQPLDGQDGMEAIVSTSAESWAERNLAVWEATGRAAFEQAEDLMGPVPVVVAGTPSLGGAEAPEASDASDAPRLVVVGDSDFATNEFIEGARNRDLLLNSVNWLLGDIENISVRPNVSRASRFQLTAEQFRRMQFLALFAMPQAIALIGVFAWWSRRYAPGS